jgi:hypothetical protein
MVNILIEFITTKLYFINILNFKAKRTALNGTYNDNFKCLSCH